MRSLPLNHFQIKTVKEGIKRVSHGERCAAVDKETVDEGDAAGDERRGEELGHGWAGSVDSTRVPFVALRASKLNDEGDWESACGVCLKGRNLLFLRRPESRVQDYSGC